MSARAHPPLPPGEADPVLAELFEELTDQLQAGRPVDVEAYARAHPEYAEQLRHFLPAIEALVDFGQQVPPGPGGLAGGSSGTPHAGALGDYRIVREVGRGGMGVVYEAVQLSLGRRVALKVLPFAAALDHRQLARFQNEAQAAAHLHHQNIVPVYAVGTERGVHFYAMQFIEGQTLASLVHELRTLAGLEPVGNSPRGPASELAGELVSGRWAPHRPADPQPTGPYTPAPPAPAELTPQTAAALSTERSTRSPAFFRGAARLGAQAAEALEHAHSLGVVHRDVKPANLLVDGRGNLWVTDFGLAQVQADTRLTLTGDLLGTLRYMSPEQALAQRVLVDHRTDIYSLGVTLYELLTLQPAFGANDRQELLRQIAFEEPKPPRRINNAIPVELETIVLKAMAKNPAERYATAGELAEDLGRFLRDEPIRARRPTLVQRVRRWARRHRAVVTAVLVSVLGVLSLSVLALAVSNSRTTAALGREKTAREERERALDREQRTLYFQRVALAARELSAGNLGRAQELLDDCPDERRGWEWHYLKRRRYQGPDVLTHPDVVLSVAYGPDGRHLALGGLDGTVAVWDTRKRRPVHTWRKAHADHVYGLCFSPDGDYLATAGNDRKVRVWELSTGAPLHTFGGHTGTVHQLSFSPDGRHLASAGQDGTVRLWEVTTGRQSLVLEHPDPVRGVAFGAGGGLVSTTADGAVRVWDPTTGAVASTLRGRARWVSTMAFHPESRRLALGSWDGSVELWDGLTPRRGGGRWHGRHRLGVPHGARDGEARTLRGHTAHITGLCFSPDGGRLVSAGDDRRLKVWDPATGQEAIALDAEVRTTPIGVAFSPDGRHLAVGCGHRYALLYDGTPLSGQERKGEPLTLAGHEDLALRVAFSPDGRRLASASRDGTVKVWDVTEGKELFTFRRHTAIVSAVALSPDRLRAASGSWDGDVLVWRARDGHVLHTLSGRAGFVHDVAFGPDGKLLASAHAGGAVILWDPHVGKQVRRIRAHGYEAVAVAFSPDGKRLATAGGRDHTAKVWDVGTGKEALRLVIDDAASGRVWCIAFSPDGRSLATVGHGNQTGRGCVMIWDAATGKRALTLEAQAPRPHQVAFSPDGRWVAAGFWDETVKVWDVTRDGKPLDLRGHAGQVLGVAFSPDGKRLASCSGYRGKGEIKVWDATLWEKKPAGGR